MSENYDIQQICENGHQITGCYKIHPEDRQEFCQTCGALTVTKCQNCNTEIRGCHI